MSTLGTITFRRRERPILRRSKDYFVVRNDYCGGSSFSILKVSEKGRVKSIQEEDRIEDLDLEKYEL